MWFCHPSLFFEITFIFLQNHYEKVSSVQKLGDSYGLAINNHILFCVRSLFCVLRSNKLGFIKRKKKCLKCVFGTWSFYQPFR